MDKIERNKETMRRFETAINTADARLIEELVCEDAPFLTPVSPEPLYGGYGNQNKDNGDEFLLFQ